MTVNAGNADEENDWNNRNVVLHEYDMDRMSNDEPFNHNYTDNNRKSILISETYNVESKTEHLQKVLNARERRETTCKRLNKIVWIYTRISTDSNAKRSTTAEGKERQKIMKSHT